LLSRNVLLLHSVQRKESVPRLRLVLWVLRVVPSVHILERAASIANMNQFSIPLSHCNIVCSLSFRVDKGSVCTCQSQECTELFVIVECTAVKRSIEAIGSTINISAISIIQSISSEVVHIIALNMLLTQRESLQHHMILSKQLDPKESPQMLFCTVINS